MYLTRKIHIVNPRHTLFQHIGKQKLKQTKKIAQKTINVGNSKKEKSIKALKYAISYEVFTYMCRYKASAGLNIDDTRTLSVSLQRQRDRWQACVQK